MTTASRIEAGRSIEGIADPSRIHPIEISNSGADFLDAIGRADLKEVFTPKTPWAYWTMELYGEGIKGQGGLGILAADTLQVARDLGLPMVCVTPFYTQEESQRLFYLSEETRVKLKENNIVLPRNFLQQEVVTNITPEQRGYRKSGQTSIATAAYPEVALDIYQKSEGSVTVITVTEPNFGKVYQDGNSSDHRFYQDVALGFGGHKALKLLDLQPAMNQQLNEAPTVFSALARLDDQLDLNKLENQDQDPAVLFAAALVKIKESTMYTNHTLVQAVESEFDLDQFEAFVMPNIRNEEIKNWLREKIEGKGGRIRLSTLAIALSGKKTGVSLIHAREASKTYVDSDGSPVEFEGITNGISDVWIDPALKDLYAQEGIRDQYGLPAEDFAQKIEGLDEVKLREIKNQAKKRLRDFLTTRQDQYHQSISIPEDAKIFDWRRRIAGYKRPGYMFSQPEVLAEILQSENIHLVMSGKAHPTDEKMKNELARILDLVDQNPILRERVHFVQDYDREVGLALVQGADASINTPQIRNDQGMRISTEACGTSWEKDIADLTLLISTEDGGVADPMVKAEKEGKILEFRPKYLRVEGSDDQEEIASLCAQIRKAAKIIDGQDETSWGEAVKKQLTEYLPVICGSRMEVDYLNHAKPKAVPVPIAA